VTWGEEESTIKKEEGEEPFYIYFGGGKKTCLRFEGRNRCFEGLRGRKKKKEPEGSRPSEKGGGWCVLS